MEMEAVYGSIVLSDTISENTVSTTVSSDIVLPPEKADIEKILNIDGTVKIDSKDIKSDKVIMSGTADITMLYVPVGGGIEKVETTVGFSDVAGFDFPCENPEVFLYPEVNNADGTLLNSRKISLRTEITTLIKVVCKTEKRYIEDVLSEGDLYTKTRKTNVYSEVSSFEAPITVSDRLEVPSDMPPVYEILKVTVRAAEDETKVLTDKVLIKGKAMLSILYRGTDGVAEMLKYTLPFAEAVSVDGVNESMTAVSDIKPVSAYYELDEQTGTEIGAEVTLSAFVQVFKNGEAVMLEDCYAGGEAIDLTKSVCRMDALQDEVNDKIMLRETLSKPEDKPAVMRVFDVEGTPEITEVIVDSQPMINGVLKCKVLYLSNDAETPMGDFSGEIPFSYTPNITVPEGAVTECRVMLAEIDGRAAGENSAEVTATMDISVKVIDSRDVELIENITDMGELSQNRPAITIYFIKPGDTLWDIGKKYGVSVKRLSEANAIDQNAVLVPGNKLLIP